MSESNRYRVEAYPQAGNSIKWSTYYEGVHSRLVAAGAPTDRITLAKDAIDFAHAYEAGLITEAGFNDRRLSLSSRQAYLDKRDGVYDPMPQEAPRSQASSGNTWKKVGAVLAVGLVAAAAAKGSHAGGYAAPVSNDFDWAWDLQNAPHGGTQWVCRGRQTGWYAEQWRCANKFQSDATWPGL
ncbi:hypothetical protein OU994_18155 [Pseudoduganella sp. SL102]|uniref:hypothetical protein n=1 Tax=Pseudoduganella sp. SL102 TaxID=2995154 RepID=UPI00248C6FE5|nr:hypothetical protein [Pseudoduganella sp. SL102]WBS00245.1 hypothetical protein OU994_18155 [Pseudoduganella sp. SL102]